MNLDNSILASYLLGGKCMQKKSLSIIGLIVVCITIVVMTALVRDTLCSVHYQDGKQVFEATLAYESSK